MATAPKAVPKVVPVEEAPAAAAPKKSKKKLFILIAIVVLLLGGGGAAAWLFMGGEPAHEEGAAAATPAKAKSKAKPGAPPVFLAMEPFTVNLARENGDQFLQVNITLQVATQEEVELIKLYMPLVRSRLLMLLSSKKASELESPDGKKKLQDDIVAQVKQPFTNGAPAQDVSGVFFTSFVIQ